MYTYTVLLWPDDSVAIDGFHVQRAPWDSHLLLDPLEALAPDSDFTQGVNKPLVREQWVNHETGDLRVRPKTVQIQASIKILWKSHHLC